MQKITSAPIIKCLSITIIFYLVSNIRHCFHEDPEAGLRRTRGFAGTSWYSSWSIFVINIAFSSFTYFRLRYSINTTKKWEKRKSIIWIVLQSRLMNKTSLAITTTLTLEKVLVSFFSEVCEPNFDLTEMLLALDLTEDTLEIVGISAWASLLLLLSTTGTCEASDWDFTYLICRICIIILLYNNIIQVYLFHFSLQWSSWAWLWPHWTFTSLGLDGGFAGTLVYPSWSVVAAIVN